jgi:hypothetical protein
MFVVVVAVDQFRSTSRDQKPNFTVYIIHVVPYVATVRILNTRPL